MLEAPSCSLWNTLREMEGSSRELRVPTVQAGPRLKGGSPLFGNQKSVPLILMLGEDMSIVFRGEFKSPGFSRVHKYPRVPQEWRRGAGRTLMRRGECRWPCGCFSPLPSSGWPLRVSTLAAAPLLSDKC